MTTTDETKAKEEADKAVAEVQKAQAEAQKAQAEALKAQIGSMAITLPSSTVTAKDNTGKIEASLLAAQALELAVGKIIDAIPKQNVEKNILIYTVSELPKFQAQVTFETQIKLAEDAFVYAKELSESIDKRGAALVGAVSGAAQLLMGLLKTDYAFGGSDVDFDKDTMIIHALAGRIARSNKNLVVKLPAVYTAGAINDYTAKILKRLSDLSRLGQSAPTSKKFCESRSADLTKQSEKATEPEKTKLKKDAEEYQNAADAWGAGIQLYENLLKNYTTVDTKGVAPITSVISEGAIADLLLKGAFLLIVKLQTAGGSYYTINNLWRSLICKKPLYHMGGVVVSFVLFEGKDGTFINSGVIPVHGGFVNIDKLQKKINQA